MTSQSRSSVAKYFIAGQATFFLAIGTCFLIKPGRWFIHYGISYYSGFSLTRWIYAIGLLAGAWAAFEIALALPPRGAHGLRYWFLAVFLWTICLVAMPYGSDQTLRHLHSTFGRLLVVTEILLAIWLALAVRRGRAVFLYLLAALLMAVLMLWTIIAVNTQNSLLAVWELIFQAAFAGIVYHSLFKTGNNKGILSGQK